MASAELVDYYRRRAAEYEAIYAIPERQFDLARLREMIPAKLRGARVLEIACGTGYWTQLVAAVAAQALGRFDAALAVFWWSHVPRQRMGEFMASLHERLERGAQVVLMDNLYVEGSSTAISEIDAQGNTYQLRRFADGTKVRVLAQYCVK